MSDHDYISGPHHDDEAAVRAVAAAGECAIVRLHHDDRQVWAHVWEVDEDALYMSGARAFLQVFAENMPYRPVPPTGTTGYAMVLPPVRVACLVDPLGQTTTMALDRSFEEDPIGRDEIYEGLRAVISADRASRVPPAARALPPLLPPADPDVPYRLGPDGQAFPALDRIDPTATASTTPPPSQPESKPDRRR
jgi:hypothetical protein